jgi:hypothetical protein
MENEMTELISRLKESQQTLFTSTRKALSKRFPTLNELVYDYGRSLVISFSPNERGADGVVALSVDAKGIRLVFTQGIKMVDPQKILLGKATQIRYILVETGKELARPEVKALLSEAEGMSATPIPAAGKGKLIFKESKRKK